MGGGVTCTVLETINRTFELCPILCALTGLVNSSLSLPMFLSDLFMRNRMTGKNRQILQSLTEKYLKTQDVR